MTRRYDTLVVGGMSGLPLALRAARQGRTAFVERELLGGTRLNRGCIPTKTMIASAKVAQQVSRPADLGVQADGLRVSRSEVVDRKDGVVESIREGLLPGGRETRHARGRCPARRRGGRLGDGGPAGPRHVHSHRA
jgi:pyruvate/2-oxoglutarate dehydrogenase complex dihydrolipoamide dehydrogenase (E3) component